MAYVRDPFFDQDPWVLIHSAFDVPSDGTALLDLAPTGAKNYGVSAWSAVPNGFVTVRMNLVGDVISETGLDDIYDGPHSLANAGNGSVQLLMADHGADFPPEMVAIRLAIGSTTGDHPFTYSYEMFAEVPGPASGGTTGTDALPEVGCERPDWPYSVALSGSEGDWGAVRFRTLH